jgi:hypothetical protein
VWTGNALRDQIFSFLRMSNASEDAIDVLSTLAVLGQLNDDQLRRMAHLLQIRQPELIRLIRTVVIAGLIDVQENPTGQARPDLPRPTAHHRRRRGIRGLLLRHSSEGMAVSVARRPTYIFGGRNALRSGSLSAAISSS